MGRALEATVLVIAAIGMLCGCQSGAGDAGVPGDTSDTEPYSDIAVDEELRFTGTEPFWGGQVAGSKLTYTTPENIEGDAIVVERFAGRGGLSFSGTYQDAPFDMTVTPGECSDAMSDRTYPFVVTLKVQAETRNGCAWSKAHPFDGPENP